VRIGKFELGTLRAGEWRVLDENARRLVFG
jgi:hypothetical protein